MMLTDHFPVGVKAKRRQIQKRRPRLIIRCVRRVANIVHRRCGGARSCRHMVGIACVVAVVLADREGIIGPRTAITKISKAINMNKKTDIEDVVRHCDEASSSDVESSSNGEEELSSSDEEESE